MKTRILLIAAVISGLTFSTFALAEDSADIKVTASVLQNCKIQKTSDINFGALDPASAQDASAQGSVVFACTKNVDYKLTADKGKHFDEKSGARRMLGGTSDFLPYALAQDSFGGKGMGFSTPIEVALNAKIAGADYKDLPAQDYADVVHLTLLP